MRRNRLKWSIKGTLGAIVCAATLAGTLAGVAHSQPTSCEGDFFDSVGDCMRVQACLLKECMLGCQRAILDPDDCAMNCTDAFDVGREVCLNTSY
jgi:hypothetical protein